ncbi:hypothetical protein NPIL_426041 [Nephila pilipes]|uniref:Uncharacterized protein n=1 Tax=Nephila pilipes TaxID=299642 RepID=A0A8X6N9I9_NEPPI|nr:hypothetical protein NPIL_426041 [Nephila pilipes]
MIFSEPDIVRNYHHIPMGPSETKKSSVVTLFDLHEYKYMNFFLVNTTQIYQKFLFTILKGLNLCYPYRLDDNFITSRDQIEHTHRLCMIAEGFSKYRIMLNVQTHNFWSTFLPVNKPEHSTAVPIQGTVAIRSESRTGSSSYIRFMAPFQVNRRSNSYGTAIVLKIDLFTPGSFMIIGLLLMKLYL